MFSLMPDIRSYNFTIGRTGCLQVTFLRKLLRKLVGKYSLNSQTAML